MIYYKAVWAFLPFGFERKNGMIVLGIDPGYAIVGYGVVEMKNNRYRTLEHGAVTTKAGTDFNRRLEIIYDGIAQVLAQYHPDAVSVEKLYFSNNKTTGIGVAFSRHDTRGLAAQLTEVVAQMREDGSMEQLVGKYLEVPAHSLEVEQLER